VFANRSEEGEIFPLTTPEIAEAQKADSKLEHCFRRNAVIDKGLEVRLVDDTYVVCKDGKMIIPKPLQRRTVLWYHTWVISPQAMEQLEGFHIRAAWCMAQRHKPW
jgi:hypothetical protein